MTAPAARSPILGGVRVNSANKVVPPRGWLFPRRVLEDNEFVYVRRGRGEFTIGEHAYPANRDHLYVFRPGVPHLIRAAPNQVIEHWYIHFVLFGEQGQDVSLDALSLPDVIPVPGRKAFERQFLQCIHAYLNRDLGYQAALVSAFFALLDQVLRAAGTHPLPLPAGQTGAREEVGRLRHTEQVMSAVQLMMQHVSDDLSLEEIAAHVCMSPSHFEKVFKRVTGSSPHTYFTGVKMERAKMLMVSTECTLTEIADQLGFASLHHFSRTFKQYEGEAPSASARRLRARDARS